MSSLPEAGNAALQKLVSLGLGSTLRLTGSELEVKTSGARVSLPAASVLRRTVNGSLLPRSLSPESRQHLLYAILQDFVQPQLLMHKGLSPRGELPRGPEQAAPFGALEPEYGVFEAVYRMPPMEPNAGRGLASDILFPIHVSVPTIFDTYGRTSVGEGADEEADAAEGSGRQRQTDKGFRGPFIEFLCVDETNYLHSHLIRVLRNLFEKTEGLTPLDNALVESLGKLLLADPQKGPRLRATRGFDPHTNWWKLVYRDLPLPNGSAFWPLKGFADQGARLARDVQAISLTPNLSRIERVAYVERLLFYHLGLFLVRLSSSLYRELDEVCACLHAEGPGAEMRPWRGRELLIRYYGRNAPSPSVAQGEYDDAMESINEAYLMLPVINAVEIGVRLAEGESPKRENLRWGETRGALRRMSGEKRKVVRDVVAFFAEYARLLDDLQLSREVSLKHAPAAAMFEVLRVYYSNKKTRRYPRNHQQLVFESVVRAGPESFVTARPGKHFCLGDELLYLLVLAMFESRDAAETDDSTVATREPGKLIRERLPLKEFEKRLEEDLLIPATEEARDAVRGSLARLGLLDRLSDVGEANFLRHPTGV